MGSDRNAAQIFMDLRTSQRRHIFEVLGVVDYSIDITEVERTRRAFEKIKANGDINRFKELVGGF